MNYSELVTERVVRKWRCPPQRRRYRWQVAMDFTVIAATVYAAVCIVADMNPLIRNPAYAAPPITCSLEYPQTIEPGNGTNVKLNPEVVIRNDAPTTLASISGEVKVYQYNSIIKAITAFASQGLKGIDNLVSGKKGEPVDELRHAALVLSGKKVVAVYVINISYVTAASPQPVQLERLFVVEDRKIWDWTAFSKDSRYQQILQALYAFDDTLGPLEQVDGDRRTKDDLGAPSPVEGGQNGKPKESLTVQPLFIQVNYVYRAAGTGPLQAIHPGETLMSGDHYKIYFEASRDCYVYIYQIDAAGQIFRLFPLMNFNGVALNRNNPVSGEAPVTLPSEDRYFFLDNTVGQETIFFAASTQPMDRLESLYDKMLAAFRSRNAIQIADARKKIVAYLEHPDSGQPPSVQVAPVTWQTGETTSSLAGHLLEIMDRESIFKVSFNHR